MRVQLCIRHLGQVAAHPRADTRAQASCQRPVQRVGWRLLRRPDARVVSNRRIARYGQPQQAGQVDLVQLLLFWGKARPDAAGGAKFHPAVLHCLDVAAVARVLARDRKVGLDTDVQQALPFLSCLHDIGKFSRAFQAQAMAHWPEAVLGPATPTLSIRHDEIGLRLLLHDCKDLVATLFPGWVALSRDRLLGAVAGHHGRPVAADDRRAWHAVICRASATAARGFVAQAHSLFDPQPLAKRSTTEAAALSWRLAGLVALADWIGSGQDGFPYVDGAQVKDLPDYWEKAALPRAQAAVAKAGLAPAAPARFTGLRLLFPDIQHPTPVQHWAETTPLPRGALLALIEDATGSGKTEAAVTLAARLLAEGRADGVFVALPTMATANAMFGRLAKAYRALFEVGTKPSLALAHGGAALHAEFSASVLPDAPPRYEAGDEAESAGSQCAAWFAADRRQALLAQVGVGTIDQALLAVLPARHAPLRQFALARKVLILDEVHAYDAYMQKEIEALLRLHAVGGGAAVLLSATLPLKTRTDLLAAFAAGTGQAAPAPAASAYPLVTLASPGAIAETPQALRDGLARRVAVRRLDNADAAVTEIARAACEGAAVAWIRNTVDDAIGAHQALLEAGVAATLFHARFAMQDRLAIERDVLGRFGPHGTGRGHVVVATQVIEQSLDLDFDLMVSDLAPADLLIQRAGRLWRHQRCGRPVVGPELLLVGPEPVDDPPENWLGAAGGTRFIYAPDIVWRSARAVLAAGALDTPGNIRGLIEAAYDRDTPVPAGLERLMNKWSGKDRAGAAVAQMNVLDFGKGYVPGGGAWDTDIATPTRLNDQPQVTLRLARLEGGVVVPWADDPCVARAWALSEVRVRQSRVADVLVPPDHEAAVAKARGAWPRWERDATAALKLVLLLAAVDGPWQANAVDPRGRAVRLCYSRGAGLGFHP